MDLQAFILAAGLGTRLRPLTNNKPKALVEVDGVSLLEINLNNLIRQGIKHIVINVHHYGEQIIEFIESKHWDAEIVISDERNLLLDTGGGLKKAAPLFLKDTPILIHNVDILSNINIESLYKHHVDSKSIATLAVSERRTSRYLLFNSKQHLIGWHNTNTDEYLWVSSPENEYKNLAFSGIAIANYEILSIMPEANKPYSIIPTYIDIAKNHVISCFEHNSDQWLDVGKPETLELASQKQNLWKRF